MWRACWDSSWQPLCAGLYCAAFLLRHWRELLIILLSQEWRVQAVLFTIDALAVLDRSPTRHASHAAVLLMRKSTSEKHRNAPSDH
jgi:hypothetical protein